MIRLRGIEAVRYGALDDACLDELGDGLTVVRGPNESGKTTLASLVRHVLYGYPYEKSAERGFKPSSGSRDARLLFDGEDGRWAVRRIDGPKHGPVTIDAIAGPDRPGLLDEIVGAVTEQTYRVVFGFGVDELAEIESGDAATVVARLYAAETGLAANPIDVEQALRLSASEIYAPNRSKPTVNALAREIRDQRSALRGLEHEADAFAADSSRLDDIERRLDPLVAEREKLGYEVSSLERAAERVRSVEEQLTRARQRREAVAEELAELQRERDAIDIDETIEEVAGPLQGLVDAGAGFSNDAKTLESRRDELRELEARRDVLPAASGAAEDTPAVRAAIDEWAESLRKVDLWVEERRLAASDASARAEAREAGVQDARGTVRSESGLNRAAGWIVAAVGLVAVVAGVALAQYVAAAFGIAVAGLGAWIALSGRGASDASPDLGAEAVRARADADAARAAEATAQQERDEAYARWEAWCAQHGLAEAGTPAAARSVLDLSSERREVDDLIARVRADIERLASEISAYLSELATVLGEEIPASDRPEVVSPLVERGRLRLDKARAARASVTEKQREIADRERAQAALSADLEELQNELTELASTHHIDDRDVLAAIEAKVASARDEFDRVVKELEELRSERDTCAAVLDQHGRSNAMTLARQRMEGLTSQALAASESYLVEALAARLIALSRDRFDRERRPEVARRAAEVFRDMTDGRYADVRVPLGGSEVSVVRADGEVLTTDRLSQGTAAQLYLAMRIGLLVALPQTGEHLPVLMDDVVVFFDPERRRGAARAIAELARTRQVVYFTCHPETAELLASSSDDAREISLERCSLRS